MFGSVLDPFWGPFSVSNQLANRSKKTFCSRPFLETFLTCSNSSSASWEPSWASYDRRGNLQDSESMVLHKTLFKMLFFGTLRLLMSFLGSSWDDLGPNLAHKMVRKSAPKSTEISSKFRTEFLTIFGPGSKKLQTEFAGATAGPKRPITRL